MGGGPPSCHLLTCLSANGVVEIKDLGAFKLLYLQPLCLAARLSQIVRVGVCDYRFRNSNWSTVRLRHVRLLGQGLDSRLRDFKKDRFTSFEDLHFVIFNFYFVPIYFRSYFQYFSHSISFLPIHIGSCLFCPDSRKLSASSYKYLAWEIGLDVFTSMWCVTIKANSLIFSSN